jgi:rhodanese-related sulfurtransferase
MSSRNGTTDRSAREVAMVQSLAEMMAAARGAVPAITSEEAAALRGRPDVVFLDVRDGEEVAKTGKIAGAIHVSRGMLEFRADETSPSRDPALSKDKTVIVYCGAGARAALAGKTLRDLGYTKVRNLGGFKDWAEKGLPIDKP